MSQVMIFNHSIPDIELYTRPAALGREYSLVEQFVEYYCHVFTRNNKKTQLAVFVEPRIESGFPDVVFASYLPSITDNWSYKRESLDMYDLKLLSHLYSATEASGARLISKLGFSERQTLTSLEKLRNCKLITCAFTCLFSARLRWQNPLIPLVSTEPAALPNEKNPVRKHQLINLQFLMDAKLIAYRDHAWRVRELRDVFSLTKLVAVEAKLNGIDKVLEQTHINTWFASHSYALTNSAHPQEKTVKTFLRHGLGLYCKGKQFQRVVKAKECGLPSSYLSFQFNEWIGKMIAHRGEASNVRV